MAYVHRFILGENWFRERGISAFETKARDRRAVVRELYGDWFANQNLKLTRDYTLDIMTGTNQSFGSRNYYEVYVDLKILDPTKAVLFKLAWGGSQ